MKKYEIIEIANQMKGQYIKTPYGSSEIRGIVVDEFSGNELVEMAERGDEIYHLMLKDFADLLKGVLVEVKDEEEEKMEEKEMKKFKAVNKRNGKEFIVTMMEDKAITFDVVKEVEKEVSLSTIKRWFELGEEIVEVKEAIDFEALLEVEKADNERMFVVEVVLTEGKVEKKKAKKIDKAEKIKKAQRPAEERATKKDGSKRNDNFRPKLDVEQVIEIRQKFAAGAKKSHLAKEYGVSFRTITCIVDRLMWRHVA